MNGDIFKVPPTDVNANTNDDNQSLGSANDEDTSNVLNADFVFDNNHKYSTRRKKQSTIIYNEDSSSDDNTDDESHTTNSSEESNDDK